MVRWKLSIKSFLGIFQDVVAELQQAKNDNLGIRAWLSGGTMLKFRSQLLLLGPSNPGVAISGQELYRLFTDAANNILAAMDKVEFYEISKVQAELSTPQYTDIDSGKFQANDTEEVLP